jgi:hypothetical protein
MENGTVGGVDCGKARGGGVVGSIVCSLVLPLWLLKL